MNYPPVNKKGQPRDGFVKVSETLEAAPPEYPLASSAPEPITRAQYLQDEDARLAWVKAECAKNGRPFEPNAGLGKAVWHAAIQYARTTKQGGSKS